MPEKAEKCLQYSTLVVIESAAMMEGMLDNNGRRKYVNSSEREAFLKAAKNAAPRVSTFCLTLLMTGARISEVLNLTAGQIDRAEGLINFECLKKRKKGLYRSVPIPDWLIEKLNKIHSIDSCEQNQRLWTWARSSASRHVADVMYVAGIKGVHASSKGLRHGYGIACIEKQIPLNLLQKWLGHSSMSTTAIYANASGKEERMIASRLWE